MESFGRERRHKYFTLGDYRTLSGGESMRAQDPRYQAIDTTAAGGFLSDTLPKKIFYTEEDELKDYQYTFCKGRVSSLIKL
jgi:oxalate---CoA ligase